MQQKQFFAHLENKIVIEREKNKNKQKKHIIIIHM